MQEKKTKKKVTKKKVVKKRVKKTATKQEKKQEENFLHHKHLLQAEKYTLEIDNAKYRYTTELQTRENVKLQIEILKGKLDDAEKRSLDAHTKYVNIQKQKNQFVDELMKIYNIKGQLKYNDETGEIVRD